MKAFRSATKRFFAEIASDAMLAALVFVPVFMGLLFRFGVPALEAYLCGRLGQAVVLAPYYPVFDLLLVILTPVMFAAAGAMVVLDEADLGLSRAIAVTPIGRKGYLASRIGVPALMATGYCAAIILALRLSDLSVLRLLLLSLCSGAFGVSIALMISCMAANKVEGLAYSKLSGLFVLGLPAALLAPAPAKYLSAMLPSFWMTELCLGGSLWLAIPALATAALWSVLFARRFLKKVLA